MHLKVGSFIRGAKHDPWPLYPDIPGNWSASSGPSKEEGTSNSTSAVSWKPLPWYGSMHFFPQPKEQHFRNSIQEKSSLHMFGPLVLQMALSLGHTPNFSARKTCLNSQCLRVSALLPRQGRRVQFSQSCPLPLIFSSYSACIYGLGLPLTTLSPFR